MFTSDFPVKAIKKRQISERKHSNKGQNNIHLGDSLDIRKPQIKKLPACNKCSGDDLEFIVESQAAEIQTLKESLEDYKLRYHQLRSSELDRWSYQMQIKQLMVWTDQMKGVKNQNIKLQEIIRKQTIQIQESRRKLELSDISIQNKYQQSLRKIELMITEKNRYIEEIGRYKLKYQHLQKDGERVKKLQYDLERQKNQIENRCKILYEEIQRLNSLNGQKNVQTRQSTGQLTELRTRITVLTQENQQMKRRLTEVTDLKENDQLQIQLRYRIDNEASLRKKIDQHLSLFVILFAQVQTLRRRLKNSQRELENVRRSMIIPH